MATNELRTRIISAIILGVAVLGLTWFSVASFGVLCALGFIILMKEWRFLTKQRGWWWMLIGVIYVGLAIGSLMIWRMSDVTVILFLYALVWGGDISGYLVGRKFGKHKIAPSISPGKSWEGLAASTLACAAMGVALTYYGVHGRANSWIAYVVTLAICSLYAPIGLLGDLFESSLKRKAGVKDSGTLIPGHGGLFDRVDALLSCAIFTTLIYIAMISYTVSLKGLSE